ncbi:serine carboxypeptidase 1-like [Telopea speciosissima]|uniref:serine carboxypeptidase 1-like n=1 Tax=Telopea speciosissima TaxID=54955 RepID=UPI001CC57774|nr:serine carboxypeptidase 1-like [Telopea speciosissima]
MFLSLVLIRAAPESSLVTNLPGFNGTFPSKHYSGYITIDETHEKKLFYYFVISERKPSQDPVVLWLNGGPGCSSLDGFMYEHGPFNFEAGKTKGSLPLLHLNPSSWSKVSNIIYLDSPAGVGLSYSKNKDDYNTGDLKTASDTHTFLLKWFQQYPEFLPNPLYLSGQSYAGVYVPTLASEVVKGIKTGLKPILNFKGYMVGNGVTDGEFDGNALVPFAHGMGLISDDLYEEAKSACNGSYWNPVSSTCIAQISNIDKVLNGLYIYDILQPCYHSPEASKSENSTFQLPPSFRQLGETERPLPVRKRMFGRAWPFKVAVRDGIVPSWPQIHGESLPCTNDEFANSWLNNEAVRRAIHAEQESVIGPWEVCSDKLSYKSDAGSMINYHKNLTSQGYRALMFSGDHDMCVPFTGTEAWTRSLGYEITDKWRQWYYDDYQVGGYTQGYAHNLTFLTIKGAGHSVAEYKPKEALTFYSRWLDGKSI